MPGSIPNSTPKSSTTTRGRQAAITIGRHPENAIVITRSHSSRRHCVIEKSHNGWRVRDLNCSNGTRINGQVVEQSRFLPGDIVSIGHTRIALVVPSAGPAETIEDAEVIDDADLSDRSPRRG